MAHLYKITRSGNDFSASANGAAQFFVGRGIPYEGNVALHNVFSGTRIPRLIHDPADFNAQFGFWAEFIEPTARCESRRHRQPPCRPMLRYRRHFASRTGGKMTWPLIDAALKSSRPFDALVRIGAPAWNPGRETLRRAIAANPNFQARHWDRSRQDF